MASRATKAKKVAFMAGRAGAVGLFVCGLFWAVMSVLIYVFQALILIIPFFTAGGVRAAMIVCAVISALFVLAAVYSWIQFGRLSAGNRIREQEEDALELERDYMMVVCSRCNATSKVRKNTVAECSYCGNHLQG